MEDAAPVVLTAANEREHARQRALLLAHQSALLDRDTAAARRTFDAFAAEILRHAAAEEAVVLPLYRELGGDAAHASPADQFEREHAKIRRWLDALRERLATLGQPPADGELLQILDAEASFKNLLAHHDLRENRILYPFLAEHADAPARARIVAALASAATPDR
ncbi:MAG: hemerythrin domain-containing protein [Planctomycetes bacterium]|nr:hemerythrin domain-containing protein [Planctomycetota bacterium]